MSRLLVCPPDYFGIEYEINPWMRRSNAVNSSEAVRQWQHLMQVLEQDVGAVLERMKSVPGLPDLVFTANAGLVVGGKAVPSRFRYVERQKEEAYFEDWFHGQGYEVIMLDLVASSKGPETSWDFPTPGSVAIDSDRTSKCSRRSAIGFSGRLFRSNWSTTGSIISIPVYAP